MAPPLKSVVTATPHVSLTLCLSLSPSPSLSLSLSRTNPSSYTHKSDNNKDTRRCCLNPELYYTAWAFASKKEDTEIAEMKLCLLSLFFFSVFFSPCECVLVHSSAPVPAKALAASTGVRQSAATIQGLFTSAGRPSQIRLPICVWTSIHKALGEMEPHQHQHLLWNLESHSFPNRSKIAMSFGWSSLEAN